MVTMVMEVSPWGVSQLPCYQHLQDEKNMLTSINVLYVYFTGYNGGYGSAGLSLGSQYGHGLKGPKQGRCIL